jgi:BirA family biotin operon repressor/biotin-[acetyl-CoA-carboxylase] ligase
MDVDAIESKTSTSVIVYNSTASTNDVAWQYANNRDNNSLAIFAESQSKGRGRHGNKWLSKTAQSLLCSILLLESKCDLETLTLTVPLAATQAIANIGVTNARIKWPNDVLVNNKKIAGVLIESRKNNGSNDYVVGIGINCHQQQDFFDQHKLVMPATSIDIATGSFVNRNDLAAELINKLNQWLDVAQTDKQTIVKQWHRLSSQLGHRVKLQYNQQTFTGNCIGVDPIKGLILQLDTGAVRMFDAAHTTIIKQQQY